MSSLIEFADEGKTARTEVIGDRVQGRKAQALHGAWHGGRSAGYFNTVGSKEGWAPSKYDSGRKRGVEEFMDDEDLRDLMKGSLYTKQDYLTPQGSGRKAVIEPVSGYIGAKLLRKMGWVDGTGVGERVRDGDEDLIYPKDNVVSKIDMKKDQKGLGFTGETEQSKRRTDGGHTSLYANSFLEYDSDGDDEAMVFGKVDMSQYVDDLPKKRQKRESQTQNQPDLSKFYDPYTLSVSEKDFALWGVKFIKGSRHPILVKPKKFDSVTVPRGWTPSPSTAKKRFSATSHPKKFDHQFEPSKTSFSSELEKLKMKLGGDAVQQQHQQQITTTTPAPVIELFQPLQGTLGARFTSGKRQELAQYHENYATKNLNQVSNMKEGLVSLEQLMTEEQKEDAKVKAVQSAAAAGNFGTQTRSVRQWYPDGLVCRRFEVPDPFPNTIHKGDHIKKNILKTEHDAFFTNVGSGGNTTTTATTTTTQDQPSFIEQFMANPTLNAEGCSSVKATIPSNPATGKDARVTRKKIRRDEKKKEELETEVDAFMKGFLEEEDDDENEEEEDIVEVVKEEEEEEEEDKGGLFKSIFDGSDDDDTEEEKEEVVVKKDDVKVKPVQNDLLFPPREQLPAADDIKLETENKNLKEKIARLRSLVDDSFTEGSSSESSSSSTVSTRTRKKKKKVEKKRAKKEKKKEKKARKKEKKKAKKERKRQRKTDKKKQKKDNESSCEGEI